jgi:lysophospholipase L1-like esterase
MSTSRVLNLGLLRTSLRTGWCRRASRAVALTSVAVASVAITLPMLACSGSDANSTADTHGAGADVASPGVSVGTSQPGASPGAPAAAPTPGPASPPAPSSAQPSTEPSAQAGGAPLDPNASAAPAPGSSNEPTAGAEGSNGTEGDDSEGDASEGADGRVPLDPALLSRCTGTGPIRCTIDAPNGNYDVSVEVGDPSVAAVSRVSAETRHYAGPALTTAAGAFSVATFTVNVRAEAHDGGQSAPGNVLDLLIDGDAPKLHGLGIRPAPSSVTVFIASDSTAADWVSTNASALAPDETGWAQALSMYLRPGVAVANYADSGETSGSFYGKFFPPARAAMKAGDYLLIQFGHNNKSDADIARYGDDLLRYVADAKAKGVTPVIVTPVSRASATAANPGFNNLDQVARDLAAREGVALIDLTALSRTFYTTVPSKNALFIDGTHFHENGAIEVAGVVAQALKESGLGLASSVK